MDDLISRAEALALVKDICVTCEDGTVYRHRCIDPQSLMELSAVQPEQGDGVAFWKERARAYEDMIYDLIAEQGRGVKLDSIEINGEGIVFKKSQPERKKGRWIRKSPTAWMWTCTCCNKDDAYAYSAGESFEPDVLQDLFCPNCGADMRGEQDV